MSAELVDNSALEEVGGIAAHWCENGYVYVNSNNSCGYRVVPCQKCSPGSASEVPPMTDPLVDRLGRAAVNTRLDPAIEAYRLVNLCRDAATELGRVRADNEALADAYCQMVAGYTRPHLVILHSTLPEVDG